MHALITRIQTDGRDLGRGILKVDSFLNHQVDPALLDACGQELARRCAHLGVTRVLTAEISGIAPALTTALALGVPVVYARKHRPITMPPDALRATAPSHTKGHEVELLVAPDYLPAGARVLIVDDFLASGQTILALARLVQQAGAELAGIGAVIEKSFEGGRSVLRAALGPALPIESLAVITAMADGVITCAEPVSAVPAQAGPPTAAG